MKPPRALWVPFELGRPLGVPDNPEFQKKVLLALFKLFESPEVPVLADFTEDAPEVSAELTVLACPVYYPQAINENPDEDTLLTALKQEITSLRPWYDMSLVSRKRTTIGLSGLKIDELADYIFSFIKGAAANNPHPELAPAYSLKYTVEDLKSFYIEGITAQPGQSGASSHTLDNWFWDKTIAGQVLMQLRAACQRNPDKLINMVGAHFLVPGEVVRRKEKEQGSPTH
jgi:hypothetical protein